MLDFLHRLLATLGGALALDREALLHVYRTDGTLAVSVAIAAIAGASLMAGQSVTLFLNRVRPAQFLSSLSLGGILYAAGVLFWAGTVHLAGILLLGRDPHYLPTLRVVSLASAPFILGIFIFLPYLGPIVARVLRVWSLLIALRATAAALGTGLAGALACVFGGWLILFLLGRVASRPLTRWRDRLWDRWVGIAPARDPDAVFLSLAADELPPPAPPEDPR